MRWEKREDTRDVEEQERTRRRKRGEGKRRGGWKEAPRGVVQEGGCFYMIYGARPFPTPQPQQPTGTTLSTTPAPPALYLHVGPSFPACRRGTCVPAPWLGTTGSVGEVPGRRPLRRSPSALRLGRLGWYLRAA